jgi:hypothetical protein
VLIKHNSNNIFSLINSVANSSLSAVATSISNFSHLIKKISLLLFPFKLKPQARIKVIIANKAVRLLPLVK